MEDRTFKYSVSGDKVWLDLIYKGVPMNSKVVYVGKNKKDCEEWIKEKKGNTNNDKKNRLRRKNSNTKKF